MRANAGILIIIGLLFLVGTVAAIIPDTVTITSDKIYLTANGVDQSVITVIVKNTTPGFAGPIQGATISLSVDPVYGTLTPGTGTTNSSGGLLSIFKVKTKSGIANINVKVDYENFTNIFTIPQKIDHNKAYYATFSHPFEGEVNTTVPFIISFTDYYGNPIDRLINTNQSHVINLHIYGPPPDDCYFVGYGHDILNKDLDQYGNVSLQVKLTTGAGPNSITMDQFDLIPPPSQRIITAISSDVSSMQSSINPTSPPGIPADGTSKFSILYTLYDKYRNPASQKELWVNTSVGDSTKFKTDNLGRLAITYGPRIDPGVITIDATAVANPLVNSSDQVEFISTAATTIVLTANPEIMVSRDKNTLATSIIIAKITNIMGGTSPNETVKFSLGTEQYPGGPYNITNKSSFSPTSLQKTINTTTDANGDATVNFYPGGFNTNPMAVNYSSTATGQVVITAEWRNSSGTIVSKDITVKWKNYPYLSAKTSLNPDRININETVDVTIQLDADGWAIQPKPIDVLLLLDNSGSMGLTSDPNSGLSQSQRAAITFIDQMTQGKDRVGVLFYDKNTYPSFSVYVPLTFNLQSVKDAITGYTRSDAHGYHTRTRYALYQSIKLMNGWNNRGAVPAIIHMTDGQWSMEGDPLARTGAIGFNQTFGTSETSAGGLHSVWAGNVVGVTDKYRYFDDLVGGTQNRNQQSNFFLNGQQYDSGTTWINDVYETTQRTKASATDYYFTNAQNTNQNMSVYAKNSDIRVYSIGFTSGANDPVIIDVLQTMSNATGGFYAYAPDETALKTVYQKIAGDLKDTAGVDTKMVTDFSMVNVTGVGVNGSGVFDYVYHPTASTKITWQDGNSNVTDQSSDWAADNKLNFSIGTMKVGQTWEATFRLKVKKSGSIDVFGQNSALIFNNSGSIETLILPHTFLTVNPNLTAGLEQVQINVVGTCSLVDQNNAILPINWWTTYTGGPTVIFDEVNYIDDTGSHINFYKGSYSVNSSSFTQRDTIFNMRTVPLDRRYDIEVRTYTANAQASTLACGGAIYNSTGKTFIKLN